MPNWCSNVVYLNAKKEKMTNLFSQVKETNSFFELLKPIPESIKCINRSNCCEVAGKQIKISDNEIQRLIQKYGASNCHDWCLSNWGTRWDADIEEVDLLLSEIQDSIPDDKGNVSIQIAFATESAEPEKIFNEFKTQGYFITAYFHEASTAYCGSFLDGLYMGKSYNSFSEIDPTIVKIFNLTPSEIDEGWDGGEEDLG
jgi:hypothetical protein